MTKKIIEIHFLYFEGCPSWKTGLINLESALNSLSIPFTLQKIKIESNESAQENRFLGSPSFVINGHDLWPEERSNYYLGCRVYQTPQGLIGYPTVDMPVSYTHLTLPTKRIV